MVRAPQIIAGEQPHRELQAAVGISIEDQLCFRLAGARVFVLTNEAISEVTGSPPVPYIPPRTHEASRVMGILVAGEPDVSFFRDETDQQHNDSGDAQSEGGEHHEPVLEGVDYPDVWDCSSFPSSWAAPSGESPYLSQIPRGVRHVPN